MTPGPATRKPGMDHEHYPWSPLPKRPSLRWPNGARVALCVVINVEHYDLEPVDGSFTPASVPGGRGRGPAPDIAISSLREYGNRVGIFRLMKVLERHGVPATVAIDAATAATRPHLIREFKARGYDIVGHGHSVTQMITTRMSEGDEREHIRSAVETIAAATGEQIRGWFGPEYGESHRTPAILAELGVTYLFDWPNDEQPYRMTVPRGAMIALPTLLELDDTYAHWHRRVTFWRWQRMVEDAFDRLHADGAHSGRLLTLSLHPWLCGQPHRIKCVDEALGHILGRPDVWKASGRHIAEYFASQC